VENPKGWNKKWPFWIEIAWLYVLRNEMIIHKGENPEWLELPAMMQIPISSPAVLGRLKNFAKPFDFVLAPIVSKAVGRRSPNLKTLQIPQPLQIQRNYPAN